MMWTRVAALIFVLAWKASFDDTHIDLLLLSPHSEDLSLHAVT